MGKNGPGGIPTQLGCNRYSQSNSKWGDSEKINTGIFAHMNLDDSDNVMAVFEIVGIGPAKVSTLIYDAGNDQWGDDATVDELGEKAGHPSVSINN